MSGTDPIQLTTWQCPHCLSVYDDHDQALACASYPRIGPKYKVGDTVYVPLYHTTRDGKKFAQVTVTQVLDRVSAPSLDPDACSGYHQPLYVLSQLVKSGKDTWVGQAPSWQDRYEDHRNQYRPAPQDQLLQMGEVFEGFSDRPVVTPESVTMDF